MAGIKGFICDVLGIETKAEKEKALQERIANEGELATMPAGKPATEEEMEEDERNWADVNEDVKFVCKGGTVTCKYHSGGEAVLNPTSTEVKLQDKPYVTEADNDGKKNFGFTGLCTHSCHGSNKPPCLSVISLGKWKNCSTSHVDDHHPLLVKSTIPCMVSGEDLKITFSGQVSRIEEFRLYHNKKIVDVYWKDQNQKEKNYVEYPNFPVSLYIETIGYMEGDIAVVKFLSEDSRLFKGGKKEIVAEGVVDNSGLVVIEDFIIEYE